MIEGIKHIIFDLGGVLINLDYQRTANAFKEIGFENFDEIYSQLKQESLFDDFEKGSITADEFIHGIQRYAPSVTSGQILQAWNAMLLDFPIRRLQLLQQVRLHYDIVLLSNTNEIHEAAFNKILQDAHGHPSIGLFFDRVYFSHKLGLRKPMPEIFQLVLDENGFKAEHTLFIDDSPQHIEGAKKLGIKTIYLEKGMTIEGNIFLKK